MEGGHRQFDKADMGMHRWLKLVLDGRSQHQQRQHGRLAFGGMVSGQGLVETTVRASYRAWVTKVHVHSLHLRTPHCHVCHCRHSAGAQQKAMVGAGKGRKHG